MTELLAVWPSRRPRIATIGHARWINWTCDDTKVAIPGGTSVVAAMTLARLGAEVAIRANVGDDLEGRAIISVLASSGVRIDWVTAIPNTVTEHVKRICGREDQPGTTSSIPVTEIKRGNRIDIAALFGHDLVLLDIADMPLLRFLVDLPAHTLPGAKLVGTLAHLSEQKPHDAFDLLMRHDAVIGTPVQFQSITSSVDLSTSVDKIRGRMRGENLRTILVYTSGSRSAVFTIDDEWQSRFQLTSNSSFQEECFAGATAFGMAARWPWETVIDFATSVANVTSLDSTGQLQLPSFDDAVARMNDTISTAG